MPDPHRNDPQSPTDTSAGLYRIHRKGSRYNISGPGGRVFGKYKSASVVGPRWEELTHTPWPYSSSAYASGTRLWELGLIDREAVGKRTFDAPDEKADKHPEAESKQDAVPGKVDTTPVPAPPAEKESPAQTAQSSPVKITLTVSSLPALPAPRINLTEQAKLVQALKRDPKLLFDPKVQQALHHEVEYHRPQAKWARMLLKLLARYEKRQRATQPQTQTSSSAILAKHIAWQEQQAAHTSTG